MADAEAAGRSPAARGSASGLASPPYPTWKAFDEVLTRFRSGSLPATVDIAVLPLERENGGWQVLRALRVLGLIDAQGSPTLDFHRLHGGQTSVVADALRELYPALTAAIEAGASEAEVAALFNEVPAGDRTRTRFRSFLLSVLEHEGVDIDPYRRIGSGASPHRQRSRVGAPESDPSSISDNASAGTPVTTPIRDDAAWEQLRVSQGRELIAAQARAFDRSDVETARAISEEIDRVCRALGEDQDPEGPT